MKSLLIGVATLVALAGAVYALVLRFSAGPFAADPQTGIIVTICGFVVAALFWSDYRRPAPSGVPRQSDDYHAPSEVKPAQRRPSILGVLIILGLIAKIYLHHTHFDKYAVWVDTYWPIILPALLVSSLLYWFYDTVFAPLKTRLHLGRTVMEVRQVFAFKRLLLLVLAFAILLLIGPEGPGIYAAPLPQALLAGIWASWASVVLVMR